MLSSLPIPGWLDLLDIALIAGFVWIAIGYFRTTRARPAMAGIALLGVIYLVASLLDLRLTASLLQGFSAVLVLVLVVVFQEDLRRVFEQLGTWRLDRPAPTEQDSTLDLIARSMAKLASTRTGALVVLPGKDPIERHIEGGIPLSGHLSEPLLLSLFDKHSPGHDGAVLVRGSLVERFALHLPLSVNHDQLSGASGGGTRHAAALGLTERCDAVCVVVSEERGTLSLASAGTITRLESADKLRRELQLLRAPSETKTPEPWHRRVGLDGAIALLAAVALWMVFVPGSDITTRIVSLPVEVANLPDDLRLESVEPVTVDIVLTGLRRDLMLADTEGMSVSIDAYLSRIGRRTFTITRENVRKPSALTIESIEPPRVKLTLTPATPTVSPSPAPK